MKSSSGQPTRNSPPDCGLDKGLTSRQQTESAFFKVLHTASDFEYLSKTCATESRKRGWKVVEWICVAQDKDKWCAIMNMMIGLRLPSNSGNFSNNRAPVSFSISKKANLGLNQNVYFCMPRVEDNIKTDPKRHSVLM